MKEGRERRDVEEKGRREDILSACIISFPELGTENVGGSRHAIGASG